MKITHLLASALLFVGCAKRQMEGSMESGPSDFQGQVLASRSTMDPSHPKILLLSARLDLTVEKPESAAVQVKAIASNFGGYTFLSGDSRVEIRVESQKFDSAILAISNLGLMTHKNIRGQDVSDEYNDTQTKLENKEKARARYLELLAKAENVEAMLMVEKELERLNGETELLKGALSKWNQEAKLSLISVNLEEKAKLGPVGFVFYWTFRGIGWLFVRS